MFPHQYLLVLEKQLDSAPNIDADMQPDWLAGLWITFVQTPPQATKIRNLIERLITVLR